MPLRSVLALLALAFAVALSLVSVRTPAPRPASAPPAEFSAERAMAQLSAIAARPHPTGTADDDEVRAYVARQLEKDGFTVDVEDTTSLTDAYAMRWGAPVVAAHVRNLVARRRGTAGGPALMLMAHEDSRELAPGASDDGYGVATLLETARALAASPPLRHDVVLLVTDGEEQGLLGARAFFAESPTAKDVGLVLNFEARGDRGPVLMFQTSEHAAALVDVLARAAPRVAATSLSQAVYRRMPNDTDLTVALRAGLPAMNFANAGGVERYHRSTDTVANASPATLQHHGSYALALTRAFGDAEPMVPPPRGDEVYFDLGPAFVHYGERAALPLAVAALIALGIGVGRAAARVRLRSRSVALGVVATAVAPLAAGVVAWGAAWAAGRVRGDVLAMPELRATVKGLYAGAFTLMGAAVAWALLNASARRLGSASVAAGAWIAWGALAVTTAALVPGGSYPFPWPAAAGALVLFVPLEPDRPATIAAHAVPAALAAMLLLPLARQLDVAFGPVSAPADAVLAALATSAAVPLLDAVARTRRWLAPAALGATAACTLVVALALPPFDAAFPRPDSLVYAVDADRGTASWVSTDAAPDAWTATALATARRVAAPDLFPRSTREVLRAPAPPLVVGRPRVDVLSDARAGDRRTLHLRVRAPAGAEAVEVLAPPDARIASARVQDRAFSVEPQDGWLDLAYFGPPPEGLDLVLATDAAQPLSLRIVAQLRGLPRELQPTPGPRPADRMPAVGGSSLRASDMTLVSSSVQL